MPWLLLLFALGGGYYLVRGSGASSSPPSPSGKPWPVPLTTASVHEAVTWALSHETDAGKLRAFAVQLAPFDAQAASTLNLRAAVLEAPANTPLGQYVPNQTGPATGVQTSPFASGILTRRL